MYASNLNSTHRATQKNHCTNVQKLFLLLNCWKFLENEATKKKAKAIWFVLMYRYVLCGEQRAALAAAVTTSEKQSRINEKKKISRNFLR